MIERNGNQRQNRRKVNVKIIRVKGLDATMRLDELREDLKNVAWKRKKQLSQTWDSPLEAVRPQLLS